MGVTNQVEQIIREQISTGEFTAGGKLPSERTLAAEHQVGRTTVRLVLMKLSAEGLIRAEQGRGYFVAGEEVIEDGE